MFEDLINKLNRNGLIYDGTYIKQIDLYSKSSIASSAVAVTFNQYGFCL